MKALSVRQPWAALIVAGLKVWETRARACHYLGPLAIHASARPGLAHGDLLGRWVFVDAGGRPPELFGPDGARLVCHLGAIVGSARMTGCSPVELVDPGAEAPFGDYTPGRYALRLQEAATASERCPWCWGQAQAPVCLVCAGGGPPGPVPAKGSLTVPWEWTP